MTDTVYNRGTTVDNLGSSTINKRKLDQVPSSSRGIRKRKGKPSRFLPKTPIQFFVRSFPRGKTLVIQAHSTDSVGIVRNKIMLITGIPADYQRLFYKGKQLGSEHTLEFYGIEHDTTMHLLSQMRSTYQPWAWQLINDIISMISSILESDCSVNPLDSDRIIMLLVEFTAMTPVYIQEACEHMELFVSSSAPAALVMLYMSPDNAKKIIADECIRTFCNSFRIMLPAYNVCGSVVSEFCKLLRGAAGLDDELYTFCQSGLWVVVGSDGIASYVGMIQFFVRLFPGGKTLVIQAAPMDSVELIHYRIMLITGIPTGEQRLIYKGKKLQLEHTLADCGIQRDTTMQLVGRMHRTDHSQAWRLVSDLISMISDILKSNVCFPSDSDHITMLLVQFTTMTPEDDIEKACEHIKLFVSSSAPAALVMLYISPDNAKKLIAEESICAFVNSFIVLPMLPAPVYNVCVPLVSEFCKLLKGAAGLDDQLYNFCRIRLGAIAGSTAIASTEDQTLLPSQTRIQFFVHLSPRAETLVIQADSTDTVEFIHYRIMLITGIPTAEQRLIYRGKHIQSEQTLADCGIQDDESVQLVGRMQSTDSPQAWQLIDDLVSLVFDILRSNDPSTISDAHHITRMLTQFIMMTPDDNIEKASQHLQIFNSSLVPAALVLLYMSSEKTFKFSAHYSIRTFISLLLKTELPKHTYNECARMVLEFCKLLRGAVGLDDPLYRFCRSRIARCMATKESSALNEVFLFVREVVVPELSHDLELSVGSIESTGLSMSTVHDFTKYMCLVRKLLQPPFGFPISLHLILYDLLDKMELCLSRLEDQLGLQDKPIVSWWSQYLVLLKELNSISELFNGSEVFWQKMRQRKVSLCFLTMTFAKSSDDYLWVIEHKEVTDFEVRRHFTMTMLQEVRGGDEASHEMLIDRSQVLEESLVYIGDADPELLRGDLFIGFQHEEATGPGVLREWFFLVCREIFNPQKALFVACPNDRRRFLPNPASKLDPSHLEYFSFSGRMIALALMHKIQIGVVLDRVFFLQLAGEEISLEDIRDADPFLYNSCKQILEMDPETVDQDTLSLTFVCDDVEELGSKEVVELCPNGKDTVVNSKNRKEYVDLLIQYRLVTSIAPQIAHFSQGFADMTTLSVQTSLFRSLDLEDLDQMLDGSGSAISVEDWKAHTDYNGYQESDPQISWFWKIVGRMSAEQRKMLLFFWTSIKYLPLEGFGGLASRLSIYRISESCDHLPSAQTCFYQMCFPPYCSRDVMQDRLRVITQEHVSCSFGTW